MYVTMNAEHRSLIDECYSVDGEGFSPEQHEIFSNYEDFEIQRGKIFGIYGRNDFVNPLGIPLIQDQQKTYVEHSSEESFLALHYCENLFSGGKLNAQTEQGEVSIFIEEWSEQLSGETEEKRYGAAATAMQILEAFEGRTTGLNNESISRTDVFYGVQGIAESLGPVLARRLPDSIVELFKIPTDCSQVSDSSYIRVDTERLRFYATSLKGIISRAHTLDGDMNWLYLTAGLDDMLRLLQIDWIMDYCESLQQCVDYLESTAQDFEGIEAKLETMD